MRKMPKHINKLHCIWLITFFCCFQLPGFSQGYNVKKVVIDAGHGGRDPGAVGKKSKEKDIALKVALLTGGYIEKFLKGVDVIYTRTTDVKIELPDRAKIAHNAKADLFVSIHVDAIGKSYIKGASTYVLGLHRTDDNLRVAQKENSVIMLDENYKDKYNGFDPGKPESYIIFNFLQNAYLEQSTELANLIQDQFRLRVGRTDRGVHQGGFLVLRETSMPSVLVELGYITNADEERFLNTTQGQEYMASAIFRAVRDYKKKIESRNHTEIVSTNEPVAETKPQPAPPKKETPAPSTPTTTTTTTTSPVTYKLQILSSRKYLEPGNKLFKGLPDVEYYQEDNYYKYTLGESEDVEDVKTLKAAVKKRFPDAFIIGFRKGKKLGHAEVYKLLK